MKSTIDLLEERISAAMAKATGQIGCAAIVRPATDPKFGDYQANGVMALAKQIKTNPRKLAEQVVAQLDVSDLCEPPEVAGPGFINLRLKPQYIAEQLPRITGAPEERLGMDRESEPQTIVVDFSSPNVAKQMHVGHLRSTIIGDAICRLLEVQGHTVIRQNHVGDWGTQFGMLIAYLLLGDTASRMERVFGERPADAPDPSSLADTEELYRRAKIEYDSDPDFAERSRAYVVGLQRGDANVLTHWKRIVDLSIRECQKMYDSLGVRLSPDDVRGESFYNDELPAVVADLRKAGLAVESDGALCVFPPGFKTKEGEPLPFIIQKSDGAFLYATTDLAALRYRVNELKADRIVYVTDARQIQHFQMLFKVAELAGWDVRDGRKVDLVHVTFGSVLGENGKPLKTRSGENVKLRDLLDEAVERARGVVEEKNPDLPPAEKDEIAKAVGIGAVKYADYSNNRTSDYVFSFEKMLAMDGNTAPYMQYAYARVRSIERRAESKGVDIPKELEGIAELNLDDPSELDLAKHLVRYAEAVESAAAEYRPNFLTSYLYELAQKFSTFYTNCPVLDAPPDKRPTRLLLCDLTADTIRHGLDQLLGIQVVKQM
ncbi:MAG: arginine--tRNA ligase [Sedimentisphaerales bacterium]|nr:arginine--tRNA ligase [Sedimentisphaerales bacterium]